MALAIKSLAKHYVGLGKDEKVLQEAAKSYDLNLKADMWKLPATVPYTHPQPHNTVQNL